MQRLRIWFAPLKPLLEWMAQLEASLTRRWARSAHWRLMAVQWGLPPQPEHFEHLIDLYYQWSLPGRSWWVERGVFSCLALRPGGRLLELACGDGFNACRFYADRCETVIACDFDPKAIATARRHHHAPNVQYVLADIRTAMPNGTFDNIVFDAAIEHFTPAEIADLLRNLKARLTPHGILSGYTIVERGDGNKSLSHHEYEFRNKADLLRFLAPHFRAVTVFETIYPERHNLYFWASDGVLPFADDWSNMCRKDDAEP